MTVAACPAPKLGWLRRHVEAVGQRSRRRQNAGTTKHPGTPHARRFPPANPAATPGDVPVLAALNRQLLEDEGHRAILSLEQLHARHRGWMERGEWRQDMLELDGEVVGYVAHARLPDGPEIHVRQFCIDRARRGAGLGRAGFALFLHERATPGARVTLDVLESNPAGQAFWEKLGFRPYFRRLETVSDGG